MNEQHKLELRNILGLYGIRGIVAYLAAACESEGGLEFVKRCVCHLTESDLAGLLEEKDYHVSR